MCTCARARVCVCVMQMTAQERAAKSELESLVSRLRSDVVRAQEESGRLSAELDKARAQQVCVCVCVCHASDCTAQVGLWLAQFA